MTWRQTVCVPGRKPMADRFLADLVFRHRRDELVVHKQPIDVQRLGACRIGRFEFDRLAPYRILDAGKQRGLEQLRLVLELLQEREPGTIDSSSDSVSMRAACRAAAALGLFT
jgi:hypothetical protein